MKKFKIFAALLLILAIATPSFGMQELRWGGDNEGGQPYMFQDPRNPDKLIGFEVDIMDAIAEELGRKPVFVYNAWDELIPGLDAHIYDVAIDGLEVTPEHEGEVDFSIPYYKTFIQLAVRSDNTEIKNVGDCEGKVIGTLKESIAEQILKKVGNVKIRSYIVEANAYEDLRNGRLDGALFDFPIAQYSAGFYSDIKFVGEPVGSLTYAIAVRKGDKKLLEDINRALVTIRDNGKLREIYDRWKLWTPTMAAEFNDYSPAKVAPTRFNEWAEFHRPKLGFFGKIKRYKKAIPTFAKGAVITIIVSLLAMILAMSLGLLLAIAKSFTNGILSKIANWIIEIIRGTPLLIQLFFIFYGLPSVGIKFSPFTAGVLGLGINYAAYEAEIYRSGLFAIPRTQWEAALALGMTRWEAMKHVILPQATRIVIPAITNDFISLLKDSSLVSVITMVDLTKAYGQISAAYYDYFGPGIVVAAIYLLLGLPFVHFAKRTEQKLAAAEHDGDHKFRENMYRNSTRYDI